MTRARTAEATVPAREAILERRRHQIRQQRAPGRGAGRRQRAAARPNRGACCGARPRRWPPPSSRSSSRSCCGDASVEVRSERVLPASDLQGLQEVPIELAVAGSIRDTVTALLAWSARPAPDAEGRQDPGGGGRPAARAADHARHRRATSCPAGGGQARGQERLARVATPARPQRAGWGSSAAVLRRRARSASCSTPLPPPAALGAARGPARPRGAADPRAAGRRGVVRGRRVPQPLQPDALRGRRPAPRSPRARSRSCTASSWMARRAARSWRIRWPSACSATRSATPSAAAACSPSAPTA